MNFERRKFLRSIVFGSFFFFIAKRVEPALFFYQRSLGDGDTLSNLNRTENDREIMFSDKRGNRVLVIEK